MSVEELVKRLRCVDHMSVEDCFLQSPLFGHAADKLEELAAALRVAQGNTDAAIEDYNEAKAALAEKDKENERLSERVETLESFRPHWAQGYSSDSMAAQASTAALSDIWNFLGVSNQTEAMTSLAEKDKEIAALKEALEAMLIPFEDSNCRHDHHGYCQEHFLEEDCCVAKARAALAQGEKEQ